MADNLLSCRTASYGKFSDGAYAHLQSIGVRHVEIPVPALDAVGAAQDDLARHGLTAATLQGALDISADAAVAGFAAQVEATRAMGCDFIFLSVKAGELPLPTAYARLRAAGDLAAAVDVMLVLETHPDLITNSETALTTMRGVDHPSVRVNFDTANVYYYNEGVDGLAEMRALTDYLGAVHLKDTNGGFHTWHFPTFGQGIVDFREVFAIANGCGFSGPFTMEIEGCEGEDLDRAATEQRVADSVQHLRDLGCVS
jgi:inosose dehydratase